jgi:hypothetical protein
VYLFAQEWMVLHLMKAVKMFFKTVRPEDALKILAYFVNEKNYLSTKCLKVGLCSTKAYDADILTLLKLNFSM